MDWRLWCRLCATEDKQNVNVIKVERSIVKSLRNGNGDEVSLVGTIHKYFGVQITLEPELPQVLCTECVSLVTSLVNFAERVGKVQLMYNDIQNLSYNPDLNPQGIRLKYGLQDKDRQEMFMQQSSPKLHYLELQPNLIVLEEELFDENIETISNTLDMQPRITIKINKEHLVEDAANDDEKADEEYTNTNGSFAHQFGSDIKKNAMDGCEVDKDGVEDEANLATLRTTINTKRKSPDAAEQPPRKIEQRDRKRKSYFSSRADADNTDDNKSNDEMQFNQPENNDQDDSFIFNCIECPQRFKRMQTYRVHMKRTHNSSLVQFKCSQCPSIFNTLYRLKVHSKRHMALEIKRVNPCPYCDKKFTTKTVVATHIKLMHMKERLLVCEECGDALQTTAALREHMLIHTDYAPFECEICHKRFNNQTRLKKHKEIHDQNKHICAKCGLQLNSRTTLNRHMLVHSDTMQHKCDYCGRAFKRAKTLKSHLILHTGLKPYTCEFCERVFANGPNCRTHKKKIAPQRVG